MKLNCCFLFLIFLAGTLSAQGTLLPSDTPPTRALVVGISSYRDPGIPRLNFAHRDAEAFANFLASSGWVNNPSDIHLLTNDKATSGNLVKEFEWLLKESRKGDRVIIYFSGHGDKERLTSSGLGYLLTYNSPPSNYMAGGAFNLRDLQTIVNDLTANEVEVFLIFDACKSGESENQLPGASAVTANLQQRFSNEIKLLSCQPNELSKEGPAWGGGRGVFSYYLIEGLSGPADKDGNGEITVVEIENYLEDQVSRAVREQLPFAVGDKNKVLAYVSADAANRPVSASPAPSGNVSTRGMDAPAQETDPEVATLKTSFEKAVQEGKLLQPMTDCANVYYRKLMNKETFSEGDKDELKYTFVAALTDGSQEVFNAYLKADSIQLAKYYAEDPKFTLYPAYLGRACELLGEEHYLYKTFKLRQLNFETLVERVKFFELGKTEKAQNNLVNQQKQVDAYLESLGEEYSYLQEDPTHYFDKAAWALEQGNYQEAIAQAQKAIDLSPNWSLPYSLLSSAYYYSGDLDKALEQQHLALKHADEASVPYILFDLAQLLYGEKEYGEAIQLLRQATDLAPDYADAWAWLGINYRLAYDEPALTGQDYLNEAWAAYRKAIDLNPRNPFFRYEMGALHNRMGKAEKALAEYQLCLYLEPDQNMWYVQFAQKAMGFITQQTGLALLNDQELEALLSGSAASSIPMDEEGNVDLEQLFAQGQLAFEEGAYQDAEIYLLTYLTLDHTNPDVYFYLGMVYNESYRLEEAEEELSYAIEFVAEDKESLARLKCALGYTYFLQDRLGEAEATVKAGLELDPSFAEGYSLLSLIYEVMGEGEKATKAMEEYLEFSGSKH